MVPQVGKGMNQGIWKDLEEKVRRWALDRGELYIYTGPIYANSAPKTIGANKIAVPTHTRLVFWMHVKGTQEALSKLAYEGKLPLRHRWFRGTITGFHAEGIATPTDEIEIPAAKRGVMDKLSNEVRTLGYFNWRTWSSKEKLARGHWRVRVAESHDATEWDAP